MKRGGGGDNNVTHRRKVNVTHCDSSSSSPSQKHGSSTHYDTIKDVLPASLSLDEYVPPYTPSVFNDKVFIEVSRRKKGGNSSKSSFLSLPSWLSGGGSRSTVATSSSSPSSSSSSSRSSSSGAQKLFFISADMTLRICTLGYLRWPNAAGPTWSWNLHEREQNNDKNAGKNGDQDVVGTIVIELFSDVCPLAARNFKALVAGNQGSVTVPVPVVPSTASTASSTDRHEPTVTTTTKDVALHYKNSHFPHYVDPKARFAVFGDIINHHHHHHHDGNESASNTTGAGEVGGDVTNGVTIYGASFDGDRISTPKQSSHSAAGLLTTVNSNDVLQLFSSSSTHSHLQQNNISSLSLSAVDSNKGGQRRITSHFGITFAPAPELNGRYLTFGQVLSGFHVLQQMMVMETSNHRRGKENNNNAAAGKYEYFVSDCGVIGKEIIDMPVSLPGNVSHDPNYHSPLHKEQDNVFRAGTGGRTW